MSRTKAHSPYYCKGKENYVEVHNHKQQNCTLPTFSDFISGRGSSDFKKILTGCSYTLKAGYVNSHHLCGCQRCKAPKKIKAETVRRDKNYRVVEDL